MRRARRSQIRPLTGVMARARRGRLEMSASLIDGWSRGLSRKYEIQANSQIRLTTPRITKDVRHDTIPRSAAINGGVSALPMRPKACVMPCAKPQRPGGVQLDMARVAVGK